MNLHYITIHFVVKKRFFFNFDKYSLYCSHILAISLFFYSDQQWFYFRHIFTKLVRIVTKNGHKIVLENHNTYQQKRLDRHIIYHFNTGLWHSTFQTLSNFSKVHVTFFYHNCVVKLRYRKVGSKIFHRKQKYDGLLLVIWRKKYKKVEAYFTIIWKNANHLYNGIHDKNYEFLNIHYNKKNLPHAKKMCWYYIEFWTFFRKKSWKKTPLFDKKMVCIIL